MISIQSQWFPKSFATAKIHHKGSIQIFVASVKAPLSEGGWRWASITGRYPPIVTRVGKEFDTLEGDANFEGGLGVGGEPLLA